MNGHDELKALFGLYQKGLLTEEDIATFVWDEHNQAVNSNKRIDQLEKFGELLKMSLLSTVFKIKMHSLQPVGEFEFNFEKDILSKTEKERIYDLSQISELLKGTVTHATLNSHFNSGKLVGIRVSKRKTEIKESDLLKYVGVLYPDRMNAVKKGLVEIE